MEQFLGSSAGFSPATVTRLTKQWTDDHTAFQARDLSDSDYVYVWADGVHPKVRLGQAVDELDRRVMRQEQLFGQVLHRHGFAGPGLRDGPFRGC